VLSVYINFGFGCGFVMILDLGSRICDLGYHFDGLVILGCAWIDPCGRLVFGRTPPRGCFGSSKLKELAETH
jgi:hypothetical protein